MASTGQMTDANGVTYYLHRIEKGVYDVEDWPEPGDWPGRIYKDTHRGHTNRIGWRWFPARRVAEESRFERVGYHGYETLRAAAEALIAACKPADVKPLP